MNLILLNPEEIQHEQFACVRDPRRLRHLHEVHRARPGDTLALGVMGDGIGRGKLVQLSDSAAEFQLEELTTPPPPPLPVHLVLALPRPRMLARSLEHVTALGVKEITLLHTRRVEKSYWQSPELDPGKIHDHLVLGLEQARDTVLPRVNLAKGFRPFVEERLPALLENRRGLVAHPGMPQACPTGLTEPCVLLIGPEGRFIRCEVGRLLEGVWEGIHLVPRILRVETAVVALLARLF